VRQGETCPRCRLCSSRLIISFSLGECAASLCSTTMLIVPRWRRREVLFVVLFLFSHAATGADVKSYPAGESLQRRSSASPELHMEGVASGRAPGILRSGRPEDVALCSNRSSFCFFSEDDRATCIISTSFETEDNIDCHIAGNVHLNKGVFVGGSRINFTVGGNLTLDARAAIFAKIYLTISGDQILLKESTRTGCSGGPTSVAAKSLELSPNALLSAHGGLTIVATDKVLLGHGASVNADEEQSRWSFPRRRGREVAGGPTSVAAKSLELSPEALLSAHGALTIVATDKVLIGHGASVNADEDIEVDTHSFSLGITSAMRSRSGDITVGVLSASVFNASSTLEAEKNIHIRGGNVSFQEGAAATASKGYPDSQSNIIGRA